MHRVARIDFDDVECARGYIRTKSYSRSKLALVLLTYGVAELVGGNGFVAAFAFGITVGNWRKAERSQEIFEYVEVEVQILMLLTFLIFGAVLLPPALERMNGTVLLYAVLSLAVVRMVAVAASFIGSKVRPATTLFVGWFGPRGIASVLYLLMAIAALGIEGYEQVMSVIVLTIAISVYAHGISATPLSERYGRSQAGGSPG